METIQFKTALGYLFHSIALKQRTQFEQRLKKYGLTSTHQFGILVHLSKSSTLTQKQLSDVTAGDEGNTTRLINKLIEKNLIEKRKNPIDRREQFVSLRPEGKTLLEKIIPETVTSNKKLEALLTQEEHEQLLQALNKINDFLE